MKIMKKLLPAFLLMFLMLSMFLATGCSPALDQPAMEIQSVESNSRYSYTDRLDPSQVPPGGLLPSQVPQFIILGYDDNQFADGMHNVMDIVKNKFNPAGTGSRATYDGTRVVGSFFMNPAGHNAEEEWSIDGATANSWNIAYLRGHEIGNHTYYHDHGLGFTQAQWVEAQTRCNDFLVSRCDIPANEIIGFRTPFLEYSTNTMAAAKQVGFTYDSSFEGGWRNPEDGSTLYWPFTLDTGRPYGEAGRDTGTHPGLWELPIDCIFYQGGKTTGFDYNLWFSLSMTKQAYVDALKYSFDKKYNGNRSPMNIGLHSNYYSDDAIEEMKIYDPGSLTKLRSTVTERIAAMEEFVDYALTFPDVRFVSAAQTLEWMRNPVALGGTAESKVTITTSVGPNGSMDPAGTGASGSFEIYSGETVHFIIRPDFGYKTNSVTVDGQVLAPLDYAGNKFSLSNITATHDISVDFVAYPPGDPYTITYYWTFDPAQEPVEPSGIMADLLTIDNQVIATVDENLAKRYAMEGSGILSDGRVINLHNSEDWPNARFLVVAPDNPWGLDSQGGALIPWETIAVDETVIPLGTPVYIAEFDGVLLPDGTLHDGWFVARDTSHSFSGPWIDVFVATYENYMYMDGLLGGIDTCTVTLGQIETFPVTATAGPNGTISPSGSVEVVKGGRQTFYFNPNVGYEVASVTVDSVVVSTDANIESYTLSNVTGPQSIDVAFKTYDGTYETITATAGLNGSISPSGAVNVKTGRDKTFVITPDSGYVIETLTIDGILQDPAPLSYTFVNVVADHTIDVTFVPEYICPLPVWDPNEVYTGGEVHWNGSDWAAQWWTQGDEPGTTGEWGVWRWVRDCGAVQVTKYNVTVTATSGGSVSPSGTFQVVKGSMVDLTAAPDPGYLFDSVKVDGVSVGAVTQVGPIEADTVIEVVFVPDGTVPEYTITINTTSGGTVNPVGAVKVAQGGDLTVTYVANTGYRLQSAMVDGVDAGGTSYTFTNVQADNQIDITFVVDGTGPAPWAIGVYYPLDAEVTHNGKVWICKYAHTSNEAWEPGTPGLWLWEEKI